MAAILVTPSRLEDQRGWFSEIWNRERFAQWGIKEDWVQDNQSLSRHVGTLRGLHFQTPPYGQAKLVRCVVGRIWDIVVDIRAGSPTYGQHVAIELTAVRGEQLYIPVGFAHGFLTLEPETQVTYKCSAAYAPQSEAGIIWNDPDVDLRWPMSGCGPHVSDKDRALTRLKDLKSPFAYDGTPLALTSAMPK